MTTALPLSARILVPLAVILISGCSSAHLEPRHVVHGSIPLPAAGLVGISVGSPGPEFTYQTPLTRREAAAALSVGAARDTARDPQAGFLFPAMFVLGGATGALIGTSEEQVRRDDASCQRALSGLSLPGLIGDRTAAQLESTGLARSRRLADNLAFASRRQDDRPLGRLARDSAGRLTWMRDPVAAADREEPGVDTLIRIRVLAQGLETAGNPSVSSSGDAHLFNPPLALSLVIDVVAIRAADNAEIGGLSMTYRSQARKFSDWSDNDARALRAELAAAADFVGTQIASRCRVAEAVR